MNLAATIQLYFGGAGSGCRGPNCGRPATGKTKEAEIQKIAKDNKIDLEHQRSLAERMWKEATFGNFSNLQAWSKASPAPWTIDRSAANSVTYKKSLGKGAGIVYLTVGESRMADFEHGRPTLQIEVRHKGKESDQVSTKPTQRTFEWEPRHEMARKYLSTQWGLTDESWHKIGDVNVKNPLEN